MTRGEYLRRQKSDHGRKVVAVFPIHYPGEVLTALDIVAAEVWDPPVKPVASAGHMQAFVCSIAHLSLEWILKGGTDVADGLLFPHTCDSLQNLWSIVADYIRPEKPVLLFNHPKGDPRGSARAFYRAEVERLIDTLGEKLGRPLGEGRLARAVEAHNVAMGLLAELYELRRVGRLSATAIEFYSKVRGREYLWIDDLIAEWRGFLETARLSSPSSARGIPVVISGILPHPSELLAHIEDCGGRIVDDDLASCGRRVYPLVRPEDWGDPLEAIVERHFAAPPCSTISNPQSRRLAFLTEKVRGSGAKGVIFLVVKFCEPELFDIPAMAEGLKRQGIPSLVVEVEVNGGFAAQVQTRIEAFLEMLAAGRYGAGGPLVAAGAR